MNTATVPDIVIQPAGGMVPRALVVSCKTAAGRAWWDATRRPDAPPEPDYVALCLARAVLPLLEQAKRTGLVVRRVPHPVSPWDAPALPPIAEGDA